MHYVHKQLDRAVEDTGFLTPDGDEGYVIANPSEGLTSLAFTNPNIPMPKPKRQYDSVEFAARQAVLRTTGRSARSYLWSRLYGNYSGLSQSDENGRTSPNVGRGYDYPAMMFDQNGDPVYGPLRDGSSAPVQGAGDLPVQLRHGVGAERVRLERPAGDARAGHSADQQLPGAVPGSRQRRPDGQVRRRPTCTSSTRSSSAAAAGWSSNSRCSTCSTRRRASRSTRPTRRWTAIDFDQADFYNHKLNFDQLIAAQGIAQDPRFLQYNAFQAPILGPLRREVRLLVPASPETR